MFSGTFHYIFHIQFQSVFHTVNTLVLRTMVHKCPLDILHSGDQKHISHKQCQLHKSLHNCDQKLRRAYLADQTGKYVRQKHKSCHRHNHGNSYSHIKQPFKLPVFFSFLRGTLLFSKLLIPSGSFFIFLISCDLCRIHQAFRSNHKRIHKTYHTTNDGFLQKPMISEDTFIVLYFQLDLLIRTAHCNRIFILVAHHDAFHDCLATNIR